MVWRTLLQCTKKQYCIKTWHQNHLKRGTWPGDPSKSAPKRPKSVSAGANPWDGGPPRPGTISTRPEIQKNKYERNTKIQTYKIQLWTTQALDQKYKKTNIKYVSIHSYTNNIRKLDQVYCAWLIKWVIKREIIQLTELCLTRWWIISGTWWYWVNINDTVDNAYTIETDYTIETALRY